MLTECGRCSAIWSPGSEEFDEQVCSACGWRMGDNIDNDADDVEFFDEDQDDDNYPFGYDYTEEKDDWKDDDDDLIPYEQIS